MYKRFMEENQKRKYTRDTCTQENINIQRSSIRVRPPQTHQNNYPRNSANVPKPEAPRLATPASLACLPSTQPSNTTAARLFGGGA